MALGLAGQVGDGILAVTDYREGWELFDEEGQRAIQDLRLQLRFERGDSIRHDVRVDGPAVDLDGMVKNLVDQPHGVQFRGVDHAAGIAPRVGAVVHSLGEGARGREVRHDDVAAGLEERRVELVAGASRLRDVELECHEKRSEPVSGAGGPQPWAVGRSGRV